MIAPNKQNYLLLKRQLKTIVSGHKLLKEKRNGLILAFLELCRKGDLLEHELRGEIKQILDVYEQSMTLVSSEDLASSINPSCKMKLDVSKKRMSGVRLTQFAMELGTKLQESIKPDINESLLMFQHTFPKVMEMIQLQINCKKLSLEITKTNRQIANVENNIEGIKSTLKFISLTLQEKENQTKSILIKLFG